MTMTIAEIEAWLKTARELGATDDTVVRAVLRTGSIKEVTDAKPFDGAVGGPALYLAR